MHQIGSVPPAAGSGKGSEPGRAIGREETTRAQRADRGGSDRARHGRCARANRSRCREERSAALCRQLQRLSSIGSGLGAWAQRKIPRPVPAPALYDQAGQCERHCALPHARAPGATGPAGRPPTRGDTACGAASRRGTDATPPAAEAAPQGDGRAVAQLRSLGRRGKAVRRDHAGARRGADRRLCRDRRCGSIAARHGGRRGAQGWTRRRTRGVAGARTAGVAGGRAFIHRRRCGGKAGGAQRGER